MDFGEIADKAHGLYEEGLEIQAFRTLAAAIAEDPLSRNHVHEHITGIVDDDHPLSVATRNDLTNLRVVFSPTEIEALIYDDIIQAFYFATVFYLKYSYYPTLLDMYMHGVFNDRQMYHLADCIAYSGFSDIKSAESFGLSGKARYSQYPNHFFSQRLNLKGKFIQRLTPIKKSVKETFIYMMKDGHTGCIKIGRSKNPKTRERTLQSEKPSIEIMGYWPGTNKDETRLHAMYSHKRVRGEWFRLSKADVRVVRTYCETMNN